MTVRLRVVLDRAIGPDDPDVAEAAAGLLSSLLITAPRGCEVAGIAPRESAESPSSDASNGLADVWRAAVPRRELAAAWRLGAPLGVGGGMIHSPSLMAPLVRHDRAHDHDQTVVTVWSLEAWTAPERLPRAEVSWQRAMLKRAVRFADAVVVPTHAMAEELGGIVALGGRLRVISGAPASDFVVPSDAAGRARTLALPERYVVVIGHASDPDSLAPAFRAAAGLDFDVVMLGGAAAADAEAVTDVGALAQAAGLAEHRLHMPIAADASDRAVILSGAVAVVAASAAPVFPWRALEALAVGVPLVAARTAQNAELLAEGAHLFAPGDTDAIGDALKRLCDDAAFARRLAVLAADRGRAFSWRDAGERVWQLHAEL